VEHVFKNGEAHLYMVMEYLDTDLKKFIDCNIYSVHSGYLPPKIIQVFLLSESFVLSFSILHCICVFPKAGL